MFNLFKKSKEVKFCKDCKYFREEGMESGKNATCICPSLSEVDLVDGNTINIRFCATHRNWRCGKQAKYFEAKDLTNEDYYSEK